MGESIFDSQKWKSFQGLPTLTNISLLRLPDFALLRRQNLGQNFCLLLDQILDPLVQRHHQLLCSIASNNKPQSQIAQRTSHKCWSSPPATPPPAPHPPPFSNTVLFWGAGRSFHPQRGSLANVDVMISIAHKRWQHTLSP